MMTRASNVRNDTIYLIDKWLESELGGTSDEREAILGARQKIHSKSGKLSPDEADAVIACVMEEIDIESNRSDEIIDLVQSMSE